MLKFAFSFLFTKVKAGLIFCFLFLSLTCKPQADSNFVLSFDFNEHEIKENRDLVRPSSQGVTLTADRFGNEKSAIFIHGNVASYLNLGVSGLLKPRIGTISLWVNLDRRVYSGRGYESNPIISTKNGEGDDFSMAYCIIYDCYGKKLLSCASRDSLEEAIIVAEDTFSFGKWYHLALAFDDNFMFFYINGKMQQKARKNFETKYLSSDSVIVGHTASKKNQRFSLGQFDDIRIYHRVLTPNEISELYHAPNPFTRSRILTEVLKYGAIALFISFIIIGVLLRNRWKLKKQNERFEMNARISKLELKVIKAQMNPHFISNCLSAIQNLILNKDVDEAGKYIAKFSFFLRQTLSLSNKDFITLSEELDMVKLYVELEQLRFKNKFKFNIIIDSSIDKNEILIPSLITQPIVENAIWHGLLPLESKQEPQLKIDVKVKSGLTVIEIDDNGVGRNFESPAKDKSHGTKLIHDKIESLNTLFNTKNFSLKIIDLVSEKGNPAGTKVIIQLDALKE